MNLVPFISCETEKYKRWGVGGVLRVNVFDLLGLEMLGILDLHITKQPCYVG